MLVELTQDNGREQRTPQPLQPAGAKEVFEALLIHERDLKLSVAIEEVLLKGRTGREILIADAALVPSVDS